MLYLIAHLQYSPALNDIEQHDVTAITSDGYRVQHL